MGNNETYDLISKTRKKKPILLLSATGVPSVKDKKNIYSRNLKLNLLWVSSLIHIKNFGLVLECLKNLPTRINWKLRVVGGGKLLKYWKNKTKSSPLANKIEFMGEVEHDKINEFYINSDVFLFPSLREGSPTVILEAMSFGLPVIAFKQNGADIMLTDECGILIPVKNNEQMINDFIYSIVRLFENPELIIKMGKAARKRVEENFLWEKRGEQMKNIYKEYLG